jgi:pimeloyl-ACP methyl ester carboxylesterase
LSSLVFAAGSTGIATLIETGRIPLTSPDAVVQQPSLFVTGSRDPARNPAAIAKLGETLADLRVFTVLEGCGHWTQQERPEQVNELLLEFLSSLGSDSPKM